MKSINKGNVCACLEHELVFLIFIKMNYKIIGTIFMKFCIFNVKYKGKILRSMFGLEQLTHHLATPYPSTPRQAACKQANQND